MKADWGRELPEHGKNVRARLCADVERLPDVSTTQVEARESWGLAGSRNMGEFVNGDVPRDVEIRAAA